MFISNLMHKKCGSETYQQYYACKHDSNSHSNLVWLTPGTNVDQAKKLLQESGLPIQSASDLSDAAEKAVALN